MPFGDQGGTTPADLVIPAPRRIEATAQADTHDTGGLPASHLVDTDAAHRQLGGQDGAQIAIIADAEAPA